MITISRFMVWAVASVVICSASKVHAQDNGKSPDLPQEKTSTSKSIEELLSKWKRDKKTAVLAPHQRIIAENLSGVWQRSTGWDSTIFELFPIGPDTYKILFWTRGCLGGWTLERTGVYKDGILVLNRPVIEYAPFIYDRLFTIRTSQGIQLISDAALTWSRSQHEIALNSLWLFVNKTPPKASISRPFAAQKKTVTPSPKPRARLL